MTASFILSPSLSVSIFQKYGGGKAYHLKKMFDLGLPVPEWVCLSTEAFQAFVDHNNLNPVLEKEMDLASKEKFIEVEFLKASLPPEILKDLDTFFAGRKLESDYFAVRSSGSDEDSKDASFAGQFSSYLFQQGKEAILSSIKRCWASGFSARAMTYRLEKNLSVKGIKVAVVIQRMLFPEAAGVCFSRNPIDPLDRDHLLISASWGVGEGIVSGLCSCDEIKVNRTDFGKQDVQVEEKKIRLDYAHGKMEQVKNAEADIKRLCLEDSAIRELSRLAIHLETSLGGPQDIEFASEKGKVYLLQTRPITHLPPEAFYDASIMGKDQVLWDNSNIIESYSGVASPLTFSFASYTYRQVYRQFMEMMGIPKKEIDDNDYVFRNLLGLVRGRFYYHLIYWYKLVLMLPGSENNKQFLETMMGVKKTLDEDAQKMFDAVGVKDKKTPLKTKLYVTYMTIKNFLNINTIVGNFQRDFDKIYQDMRKRDWKKQSLNESINNYNYLEGEVLSSWKAPIINDYLCMIFFGLLKKLTDKWIETDGKVEGTQNDLLCGQGDLESTEPTKMLMRMSKKIDLENPRMKEKLLTQKVEELLKEKEVRDLIHPFLDRFGFRCANELKLEEPDLHDDPSFVVYTLANYVKMKTYDVEAMEKREQEIKQKAEAKVNAKLNFWQKPIYYWVLKHCRLAVRNRENLRFLRTKIFGITRHLMRGVGHNLHQLKLLNDPSHVFYLKIDEIRSIVEGRSLGDDYAKLAQDRFDLFNHYRKTPNPPDRFITKGATGPYNYFPAVLSQLDLLKGFGIPDDPNMLIGTPCCPGVIEGVVRVAKEFSDAEGLNGDILVTERTDPGWVPLYPSCSGLLIERGSLLSHSAVVARELGLPTIIGVNGGLMTKLKTGDRVRIDASTGVIQILRDEASPEAPSMRLVSLNDHPDWKNVFCELTNRVLMASDKPYAMKPEYVAKILDLNFGVPSEAFFFEDPTGEFFGRILLQGSVLDKELGHWGLFCLSAQEKHVKGFKQLMPEIEKWFKDHGIKKIVGPYLYTTFFPYRVRSDDLPERFPWEPNQPRLDYTILKDLGFDTHQTYFTNVIDGYGIFATKGTREYEEALKLGFGFKDIDRSAIEENVKIIYDLSMQGFTDNYLFAPIPFELFRSIYVPSFQSVDLRTSCLITDPTGKPVGFNFTFVMDGQIVIKSVCTLPEYRGKGLLNAGIRHTMLKCFEHFPDVKKVATALIHEDNGPSRHVANQTADRSRHEYVLMSKEIK